MNAPDRHAWIDASAGVAGDMLLGALLDAGASLTAVQNAIDAVVPDAVSISTEKVLRAGLSATRAVVEVRRAEQPHRRWRQIETMLTQTELADPVRDRALTVFSRLAEAEAAVHGIGVDQVHFHEVGALDSIADVVGVSAALEDLGAASLSAGEVAVGSGRITIDHGEVGVPVPAVVEMSRGWRIRAGGLGELTTPTGLALLVALAETCEDLPALRVEATGTGAGTRDPAGRANVTRVIIGERRQHPREDGDPQSAIVLEANVDDLDPRLWPGVLKTLLGAGASDAWLAPIMMKKGRPAHLLSVLCSPAEVGRLRDVMVRETSTIGVRQHAVDKYALPRGWVDVVVDGVPVWIKVAHRHGTIRQATPEFDSVTAAAGRIGRTPTAVLAAAVAAATDAGLIADQPLPASVVLQSSRPLGELP
jgi:pyridinium-3,5-bisthiocarboxylic acid mononucleotide nickel chelatase